MADKGGQGDQGGEIRYSKSADKEGHLVCYHTMSWLHRYRSNVSFLCVMAIDNSSILRKLKEEIETFHCK